MGVLAADDLVDEAAIASEIVEVAGAAQQQGVGELALEMAMRTLDRTVLVRFATVVAGGKHPVMAAQIVVAAGEIALRVSVEIFIGGRE